MGDMMDQQRMRDIMGGVDQSFRAQVLRCALAVAAGPYAAVTWLRRRMYRWGLLPSRRPEAPVICVGNLTTGGTGKSPMVAWVVNALQEMGHRPAILTRGYKASAGKSDEATMLLRQTSARVYVNPDRTAAAAEAVRDGADVLVMDDGFQHLRLRRDLDIVLIDATNPFGYGWVLPRGMAREPRSALRDANVIVITRSDRIEPKQLEDLSARLERLAPQALHCWAEHKPIAVIDEFGDCRDLSLLAGKAVYAFAGIARPEQFFTTAAQAGARLVGQLALDDHAAMTDGTRERIHQAATEADASVLLTTQKDFARLARSDFALPVWQLAIEIDLFDNQQSLLDRLLAAAGQGTSGPRHGE